MRKYPAWIEMPVQVTEIRVKGKRVELDVPFLHTEDWLRDFSVVVKNISDKPILGLSLNLEWATDPSDEIPYIPETFIYAGQQFLLGPDGPGRKLVLKPGETIELFVEQSWWESHNNHIAGTAHETHKQIPETIRRSATLKYDYVGFDRDYAWVHGFYSYRDPDNQNVFKVDETRRKKISRILKQEGGQVRVLKASYMLGGSLPGCQIYDSQGLTTCTRLNCPGQPSEACAVQKANSHDGDSRMYETLCFQRVLQEC
jgi:hypothetical protein